MPNFLVADCRTGSGSTVCQAYQYVNATPVSYGNTFGTAMTTVTSPTFHQPNNMIIQFQGDIFAVARDGIYRKTDPTVFTGGWTLVHTFGSPSTSSGSFIGLHPIEIDGTMKLTTLYPSSTANDWYWVEFDGTTWTEAGAPLDIGSSAPTRAVRSIQEFRGILYITGINTSSLVRTIGFDPSAKTIFAAGLGINSSNYVADLCVFDDRMFALALGNDGDTELHEFNGTTFDNVDDAWTGINHFSGGNIQEGKYCLFTDGTYMYGLVGANTDATTRGWYCYRWDTALTRTDISTEVLPTGLLNQDDGGNGQNADITGFQHVIDVERNPTAPVNYLFYYASAVQGSTQSLYRWNYDPIANPPPNAANKMTSIDTGGDVYHSLCTNHIKGGSRIFSPGELDVKIASRSATLGGEVITFRAYGGGTGRTFKLFYEIQGNPALQEATLKTPVTGGSATFNGGANQVENIAADGVTDYTIVWDIVADGLSAGDYVVRYPQITD